MCRQIFRAGAHDPAHGPDLHGDHAAIAQRTDPNRKVNVIVQQLGITIRQDQPDIDVGVGCKEFSNNRYDVSVV
jgi:hypothetical protein